MNTKNTITSRKLAACSALALSLTVFTARAQEAADPAAAQQSGAVQSQQKSPIELSIEQRLENLIVGSLDGAEGEDGKRRMQLFLRAPNLPEGTDVKSLMALPLTQQDATAWIIGPDGRVRQQQLQPGDLAPNTYRIVPNQIAPNSAETAIRRSIGTSGRRLGCSLRNRGKLSRPEEGTTALPR